MPSRDIRRVKQKKSEKVTDVEKKIQHHPLIYAFSLVILIIIVVTFIGSPVARYIGGTEKIVFGRYGNKPIEFLPGNYLSRQKDLIAEQLRQTDTSGNVKWQAYRVWRAAFEKTAILTGILLEAERSGLHITEEKVDRAIVQYGPYMEDGEFSERLYRETPNEERATTRQLFRENLIHEQYLNDMIYNLKYSPEETDFVKKMAGPERKFHFIQYTFKVFPADMVIEYGKEHSELFRQIKLSRITINTSKSDAEKILKQLADQQASFQDLAATQSQDAFAEKGGEMGWRRYYSLEEDFKSEEDLKRVFNMKKGEISTVIEMTFGWSIFKCDEEAVEPDFTNEETEQEVRRYMERFEAGMIEDYLLEKARDFRSKAEQIGFELAGEVGGLPVNETTFFPINYSNLFFLKQVRSATEGTSLGNAAYSEDFFIKLFSLKEKEVSEPILLNDRIVVAQMLEERHPKEEELEQLELFYPQIINQFRQEDLIIYFLTSEKLEDNFDEVFSKLFNYNE